MRTWSFYHRETGAVHSRRYSNDLAEFRNGEPQASFKHHLAQNTPADHVAIEAVLDHRSQRVDVATGKVLGVESAPAAPAPDPARKAALAQIRALESGQDRAVREALLTGNHDRLADLEARIAALRKEL